MILKFRSKEQGCWVYEDSIRRVKSFECRFVHKEEAEKIGGHPCPVTTGQTVHVKGKDGKHSIAVPMRVIFKDTDKQSVKEEIPDCPIDYDWIVDVPRITVKPYPPSFKAIQIEYRNGAGWDTQERTLIFDKHTRVFLCGDDGKTIERL